MRSTLALLALGAASVAAVAVPKDVTQMKRDIISRQGKSLVKRNSVTQGADDATILQFALILEHLEDVFYSEALAKFDEQAFADAGYAGLYPILQQVAADEASHVAFLTTALKAAGIENPPARCEYSFPYTDVSSFLGLSQVIENVGVSAYLGAAADISDPGYVTVAGSILTVEARHNAFIRFLNNYVPFPNAYDTPQSASNVVGIVTPFFTSCPEGSGPTIPAFPALTLASSAVKAGETIQPTLANSSSVDLTQYKLYCGFAYELGAYFSDYENGSCVVPEEIGQGQAYVTLTRWTDLADKFTLAGPAIIDGSAQNATASIPTIAAAAPAASSTAAEASAAPSASASA